MNLNLAVAYYADSSGRAGFYTREELKAENLAPDSLFCHGLHYSGGVFEGIRAVSGLDKRTLHLLTFPEHIQRLERSGEFMKLRGIDLSSAMIVIPELIARNIASGFLNPTEGCYVRPLVYKDKKFDKEGNQGHGLGVYSLEHQTVMTISLFPWGAYLDGNPRIRVFEHGIASPLRRFKCCANYGFGGLAKDTAIEGGYAETLVTDVAEERNVLEGGGENVFIAEGKKVITPDTDQDILPGTKRRILIEMLTNLGIEVEERKVPLTEFMSADAAIFTGTAAGVVGIASVDEPIADKSKQFDLEHHVGGIITVRDLEREYQDLINGRTVDRVHLGLQLRVRTLVT